MILTDAGPLIAVLDRDDEDHRLCIDVLAKMRGPMVTTAPALTEAMYLLASRTGWKGQEALLKLAIRGDVVVADFPEADLARCRDLMDRYKDLPMDFADATLIVLAERLRTRRVFTLDSDFRTYRYAGKHAFTMIPRL